MDPIWLATDAGSLMTGTRGSWLGVAGNECWVIRSHGERSFAGKLLNESYMSQNL
ncbi:MAG: hypothetical protein GY848_14550 [Methyloversatilis sp.]|nr:hypothetical protein [Methyloversatilis sp.]